MLRKPGEFPKRFVEMSVKYRFKSALEYETLTFSGNYISVANLRKEITKKKRLAVNSDYTLQIMNAESKHVYEFDPTLIPANTSLIIARIPVSQEDFTKTSSGGNSQSKNGIPGLPSYYSMTTAENSHNYPTSADNYAKVTDLTQGLNRNSQNETISDNPQRRYSTESSGVAVNTSNLSYVPATATRPHNSTKGMYLSQSLNSTPPSPSYRCFKCGISGHWIRNCPNASTTPYTRKSTGIPRSHMIRVSGAEVPGSYITPDGVYAVPLTHCDLTADDIITPSQTNII